MTTRENLKALYQGYQRAWVDLCAREKAGDPVTAERIRAGNKLIVVMLFLCAAYQEKQ